MKRIRLTENQLHRLIEQAINELDIRTRADAANKAGREWDSYNKMADDTSNNSPKRNYAKQMTDRRLRQFAKFHKSVLKDLPKKSHFRTHSNGNQRGELTISKPITYDNSGEHELHYGFDKPIRNMAEYLKGNSYYDKGRSKWLNPDDEGYDKKESEPWAEIRGRKNESLARRVTESVLRKLNESSTEKQIKAVKLVQSVLGIPFEGNKYNGRDVSEFLSLYYDEALDKMIRNLQAKQEQARGFTYGRSDY